MIDPSVLDLLNAVVRSAPDNAVDVVAGAADFDQIERVWSFAKTQKNGAVLDTLRNRSDHLTASMAAHMIKGRRINLDKGMIGYRGLTFERRLAIVVDVADRLANSEIATLIAPLFSRLQQEWESERLAINDAIELLSALDGARSVVPADLDRMIALIKSALMNEIQSEC